MRYYSKLRSTRFLLIPLFACLTLQAQTQNNLRFNVAAGCAPVAQSLGSFDITMTPSVTPITVANFLSYVNSGAYNCTIIHRSTNETNNPSDPPFVIQGGGYVLDGILPLLTPQMAPITNEYSAPNTAGTIAMALSAAGIDSATNQWFVNTQDNSSAIDSGMYTVFGSVANNSGMNVVNAINQLPTYAVDYGQESDFSDLPLYTNYSCTSGGTCPLAHQQNFIFVTSITTIGAPQVTAAGVTDAATYLNNNKIGISPGEIITLFGSPTPSFLGPGVVDGLTLDSTGTYAISNLDGTQVTFNGVPGPIVFTLDNQIAVIVPYEIANASTVDVVVSYLGGSSNTMTFNVVPATPGLFTLNFSGQGDASIVRYSDSSVISASNPASVGDTLELYGEGYGVPTSNTSLPDGEVVTGSILPVPAAATTLLIDGQPVPTAYVGAAGGDVNGVLQINFVVPQLAPGAHQIQLKVGSATSPTGVTLHTM